MTRLILERILIPVDYIVVPKNNVKGCIDLKQDLPVFPTLTRKRNNIGRKVKGNTTRHESIRRVEY